MAKKKPKKSTAEGYWADEMDGVDPRDKPEKKPEPLKVSIGDILNASKDKRR
jgi:hypothetical protein